VVAMAGEALNPEDYAILTVRVTLDPVIAG
jgi:hypothetical protein